METIGFIFILVLGTLFHFMFDWIEHKPIGSYLFAINESTWEHMKLVVFPSILWLLICLLTTSNLNYLTASLISLIIMLLFIPLFFHGYRLFLKDIVFLDILDFIIAILLGQIGAHNTLKLDIPNYINIISLILIVLISISFIYHTIKPGKNQIFKDPITKK